MMKKKMMIIVPLSPMGSSPISGEQMKTHIKKQRPAPVSPPPIADRPLFHVPLTLFPYEALFPCVREEECCFMVQLRHDTDKNQVPSLHPSLTIHHQSLAIHHHPFIIHHSSLTINH